MQAHRHQHVKQHPKQHATTSQAHPAIKSCKNAVAPSQAPQTAPQTAHPNSICVSPPTARPLAPSRQSCKSLSPLELEVRIPCAFSYLGNKGKVGRERTPQYTTRGGPGMPASGAVFLYPCKAFDPCSHVPRSLSLLCCSTGRTPSSQYNIAFWVKETTETVKPWVPQAAKIEVAHHSEGMKGQQESRTRPLKRKNVSGKATRGITSTSFRLREAGPHRAAGQGPLDSSWPSNQPRADQCNESLPGHPRLTEVAPSRCSSHLPAAGRGQPFN